MAKIRNLAKGTTTEVSADLDITQPNLPNVTSLKPLVCSKIYYNPPFSFFIFYFKKKKKTTTTTPTFETSPKQANHLKLKGKNLDKPKQITYVYKLDQASNFS